VVVRVHHRAEALRLRLVRLVEGGDLATAIGRHRLVRGERVLAEGAARDGRLALGPDASGESRREEHENEEKSPPEHVHREDPRAVLRFSSVAAVTAWAR